MKQGSSWPLVFPQALMPPKTVFVCDAETAQARVAAFEEYMGALCQHSGLEARPCTFEHPFV